MVSPIGCATGKTISIIYDLLCCIGYLYKRLGTGNFHNEFVASNASINFDPDFYAYSDWIEIFNAKDETIEL